jgi:hypothetical protein
MFFIDQNISNIFFTFYNHRILNENVFYFFIHQRFIDDVLEILRRIEGDGIDDDVVNLNLFVNDFKSLISWLKELKCSISGEQIDILKKLKFIV